MPRARDPNRDKAKEMYLESKGKMLLKDIAKQLGKSDSQIRKWKNQDKWDDHLKGNVTNQSKGNVTKRKEPQTVDEQKGIQPKKKGNPNPKNQFTKRNVVAVKHGFYRKWLDPEIVEILDDAADMTIADRLWFQIETKFASLVRLQKIMWVENANSTLNETSGYSSSERGSGETFKVVYAFERYAEYIKTEARLTAEWRNVVKQFLELSDEYDERRMKLEQMQLKIDKTKTDIERNKIAIRKENGDEDEFEDDGFIEALNYTAADVWKGEDDE